MYTPETIKDLIRLGGHIKITGIYTPDVFKDFARLAKSNNVNLTIKVNAMTPELMKDLIRLGDGNITLEI